MTQSDKPSDDTGPDTIPSATSSFSLERYYREWVENVWQCLPEAARELKEAGAECDSNTIAISFNCMNASEILTNFVTRVDDDERSYDYTHLDTGRRFSVRRSERADGKNRFFLCEMHPNGRMLEVDERGGIVRAWDEPRIHETESRVGPNELLATLRSMGIDVDRLVFVGAGYSVDSIYHKSLETCAECIARALNDNVRYTAYRKLSPEEEASLEHLQAVQSVEYWHEEAEAAKRAEQQGSGLFKGCYTMMGHALEQDVQQRILTYLNAPTLRGWLELRSIVIAGHITLWQAWVAADVLAPRSGDKGFPTPKILRLAIRQCIRDRRRHIKKKIDEVGPRGLRSV